MKIGFGPNSKEDYRLLLDLARFIRTMTKDKLRKALEFCKEEEKRDERTRRKYPTPQ